MFLAYPSSRELVTLATSADSEQNFSDGEVMAMLTELEVNGKRYPVNYPPDTPLLYVLRDELGLTGSKYGCGEGQCGACAEIGRASCRERVSIDVSAAAR